jgi:hypothetical protein
MCESQSVICEMASGIFEMQSLISDPSFGVCANDSDRFFQ